MKDLAEFNEGRLLSHCTTFNEPVLNGIACPDCGKELMDSNPNMTLCSHPPQKNVECSSCDYTGYRYA